MTAQSCHLSPFHLNRNERQGSYVWERNNRNSTEAIEIKVCVWDSKPDGWDHPLFSIIHVLSLSLSLSTELLWNLHVHTYTHTQPHTHTKDFYLGVNFPNQETHRDMGAFRRRAWLPGKASPFIRLTTSLRARVCTYMYVYTLITASAHSFLVKIYTQWTLTDKFKWK